MDRSNNDRWNDGLTRSLPPITTPKVEDEEQEHPHVLPLIEALADSTHLYLVFPYADGGELFEVRLLVSMYVGRSTYGYGRRRHPRPQHPTDPSVQYPNTHTQPTKQAVAARPAGLSEAEARRYFNQIVSGLRHLQRHGLAHGCVGVLVR